MAIGDKVICPTRMAHSWRLRHGDVLDGQLIGDTRP